MAATSALTLASPTELAIVTPASLETDNAAIDLALAARVII